MAWQWCFVNRIRAGKQKKQATNCSCLLELFDICTKRPILNGQTLCT
jgi:hypothetical protein